MNPVAPFKMRFFCFEASENIDKWVILGTDEILEV